MRYKSQFEDQSKVILLMDHLKRGIALKARMMIASIKSVKHKSMEVTRQLEPKL